MLFMPFTVNLARENVLGREFLSKLGHSSKLRGAYLTIRKFGDEKVP